jgi:hypothetical protein
VTTPPTQDANTPAGQPPLPGRELEWGRRFAALTLAWLAFETLTGLAIYLLPHSVPNQWQVVLHTIAGLVFLAPILVYHAWHLLAYWSRPATPKWMGYLSRWRSSWPWSPGWC